MQASKLESDRFESDRVRLGSAWFRELFPSATEDDVHAVQRLIRRTAFTSVTELERTGGRYGLVSMCCGGGLGTGTIIERL